MQTKWSWDSVSIFDGFGGSFLVFFEEFLSKSWLIAELYAVKPYCHQISQYFQASGQYSFLGTNCPSLNQH